MAGKILDVFERIDIVLDGAKLTARPIEFILDQEKNPISATLYEATCPSCGGVITFSNKNVIMCGGCHVSNFTTGQVKEEKKAVKAPIKTIEKDTPIVMPFRDPIALGIFK